jgi:hypothetical protein
MTTLLDDPMIQFGALGLAFLLTLAFTRAFFALQNQRHELEQNLFAHHCERERAFTDQFMACIDRNSAALEKVEQSLQRIQIQLARNDAAAGETIYLDGQ